MLCSFDELNEMEKSIKKSTENKKKHYCRKFTNRDIHTPREREKEGIIKRILCEKSETKVNQVSKTLIFVK